MEGGCKSHPSFHSFVMFLRDSVSPAQGLEKGGGAPRRVEKLGEGRRSGEKGGGAQMWALVRFPRSSGRGRKSHHDAVPSQRYNAHLTGFDKYHSKGSKCSSLYD